MNEKPIRKTEKKVYAAKKSHTRRRQLNTQEFKEKVMLDFVIACGDIRFIKSIADGKDVSKEPAVLEAAMKAREDWKKAPPLRGCYDPYISLGECIRHCFPNGITGARTQHGD